ncbi:alpha/beta fold hydrolase [Oceanobacillus chungangensis]|uniref:alpha/beta fold hydrolase n=1 Tax=Oceanobacillus chungangensis TaxID=1229152 RepID=UPI001FE847CA|nr:alpha/beta fold hydrolase [Oceanobacillus chungangensis]
MKQRSKISIAILIAIIICGIVEIRQARTELSLTDPIVFVHGYKGTENSFGYMLDRFEKEYHLGNKGLLYYVSANGHLHDYIIDAEKSGPNFIQVVLENNRDDFADSTDYLASVMQHLKEKYGIESVNLVGHSMGGIISMKYIMGYMGQEYPNVDKLITIGSPFDGIYSQEYFQINVDEAATDLMPNSLALELLHASSFPKGVNVLSIGSTGDVVAVPESVATLRSIVPEQQLQEIMLEDENLGHSALHESAEVDKLIHSFLWQDGLQ